MKVFNYLYIHEVTKNSNKKHCNFLPFRKRIFFSVKTGNEDNIGHVHGSRTPRLDVPLYRIICNVYWPFKSSDVEFTFILRDNRTNDPFYRFSGLIKESIQIYFKLFSI